MTNTEPDPTSRLPWPIEIAATAFVVAASTGIAWTFVGRDSLPDVVMLQLLGVVAVAMRFRFAAAILAAGLSVASYDFFFLPPYFSFRVYDPRHLVTFAVMFAVGVVISTLTRRIRDQAAAARAREERTGRLYAMTRELSSMRAEDRLEEIAARHLGALVEGGAEILSPGSGAEPRRTGAPPAIVLPLVGSRGELGALRVVPRVPERFADPEQRRFLEAFAALIAGALERARSAGEAEAARLETEAERLQSSLLSSVSHDLRTPLAVITGAASTLLSADPPLSAAAQRDLCAVISEESVRLTRLVGNLLDMTRLAAGAVRVSKEWQSVEGVVGAAIARVEDRLGGRPLDVEISNERSAGSTIQ
jgi:two-component system sensor histidine kinase KdpD